MIERDLVALERGVQGFSVITDSLESIMNNMANNKVPDPWNESYFSLKPLSRWIEDLKQRMEFFSEWCHRGLPYVFWMPAFTYPQGFTTALLQRFSRKSFGANIISFDRLEFDFIMVPKVKSDIMDYAKDGAYVHGLILEGAKWNTEKMYLCEPEIMELHVQMPVIHFKPITKRNRAPAGIYECPLYYYPIRQGTVSTDSWIMKIDLKSGEMHPNFWVKRGTALLLSTAV
jgi:dynein heavy chain, axonemal